MLPLGAIQKVTNKLKEMNEHRKENTYLIIKMKIVDHINPFIFLIPISKKRRKHRKKVSILAVIS